MRDIAASPSVQLVQRGLEAFQNADQHTLRELFAPDIRFKLPLATSFIKREYRGVDDVFGFFGNIYERTNGNFRFETLGLDEMSDGTIVHLCIVHGTRPDGRKIDSPEVHAFKINNGKVYEVTVFYSETAPVEAFWA